jgi:cytochrome c oxidase subunit I
MSTHTYSLPVPQGEPQRLARGWLYLAVASLVLSGLFAVLIVLSRAPYVSEVFPWVDFFHVALVVHVDLSVLVWFLAFAGIFWSLNSNGRRLGVASGALGLAVIGTLIMSAAPFLGASNPVMSNYVPVLDHPLFLGGLLVFGAGFALLVLHALATPQPVGRWMSGEGALRFGINTAAVAAAVALLALAWSYARIPSFIVGKEYYEVLFWGSGHVLQFMHTQLMLVAWLWLACAAGISPRIGPRMVLVLLAWGVIAVFLTPVIYLAHDAHSFEHRQAFTLLMGIGGGLAALPIGLAILLGMLQRGTGTRPPGGRPERAALTYSILLFGAGGVLGFMITGSNTIVPAHYHGSIVGITMAFMGISYHLLPQLGFRAPATRLARLQPHVFGVGQLLHVAGLAWSGGHGVQRKTAGSAQGLENLPEILGMAIVGLGGLIAVAGGVMFLVVILRAMIPPAGLGEPLRGQAH